MQAEQVVYDWMQIEQWVNLFRNILKKKNKPTVQSLRGLSRCVFYEKAKEYETKERNLIKALQFYAKAAVNYERINSCIKDFAAVLHQCGYTKQAIEFLKDMKKIYNGDYKKFDRLLQNFEIQINPTGKHNYTKLLLNLREYSVHVKDHHQFINIVFANPTRIRIATRYLNLSFSSPSQIGKYILLTFDTFSAAKKTLETFHSSTWFGIDKYWVDTRNYIVAEAQDGRQDFERSIVMNAGNVEKVNGVTHNEDLHLNLYNSNGHLLKGNEHLLREIENGDENENEDEETEVINLISIDVIVNFFHQQTLAQLRDQNNSFDNW